MLLAIITRFFVSFIKEPVLISMFGFFMIKLDRWITSENNCFRKDKYYKYLGKH